MPMDPGLNIELHSLIERMPDHALPIAAAAMLDAWCDAGGASYANVSAFIVGLITAQESDHARNVLIAVLAAHTASRIATN
jgi:hypothetical protein